MLAPCRCSQLDGLGAVRRGGRRVRPWGRRGQTLAQGPGQKQGAGGRLEPPRRFVYEFLSGLPIRDYRAEVTLDPGPEGATTVRWHSTFRAKVPGTGWAMRWSLKRFIAETAEGLARRAEKPE